MRNVAEKVARLDPDHDQILREILNQFCHHDPVAVAAAAPMIDKEQAGDNDDKNVTQATMMSLDFMEEPIQSVYVCENYGKTVQRA